MEERDRAVSKQDRMPRELHGCTRRHSVGTGRREREGKLGERGEGVEAAAEPMFMFTFFRPRSRHPIRNKTDTPTLLNVPLQRGDHSPPHADLGHQPESSGSRREIKLYITTSPSSERAICFVGGVALMASCVFGILDVPLIWHDFPKYLVYWYLFALGAVGCGVKMVGFGVHFFSKRV